MSSQHAEKAHESGTLDELVFGLVGSAYEDFGVRLDFSVESLKKLVEFREAYEDASRKPGFKNLVVAALGRLDGRLVVENDTRPGGGLRNFFRDHLKLSQVFGGTP